MSKQKDASTCDERQVENKPKPLTNKKEGETRKMNHKSMNHWKMAALFVVGLMAMAGLFVEDASAQTATVRISPTSVQSDSVVSRVTVHYTIQTLATGSNNIATGLTLGLPTQLSAANDSGSVTGFFEVGSTPAKKDITAPTSLMDSDGDKISYVTTTDTIPDSLKDSTYAITVGTNGDVTFPSVAMRTLEPNHCRLSQCEGCQVERRSVES